MMRAACLATVVCVALACVMHGCGGSERFVYALGALGSAVLPTLIVLAVLAVIVAITAPRKRPGRTNHLTLLLVLFLVGGPSLSRAESPRSYPAQVLAVHDGDTLTVLVDLGFDLQLRTSVRLAHLDAPELPLLRQGYEGQATHPGIRSRDALRALLLPSALSAPLREPPKIRIESPGRDKYGRVLGTVWLGTTNVNAWLLQKGYARPYEGGARGAPTTQPQRGAGAPAMPRSVSGYDGGKR